MRDLSGTGVADEQRQLRRRIRQWGWIVISGWIIVAGCSYVVFGVNGFAFVTALLAFEVIITGNRERKELLREAQVKQMRDAAKASRDFLERYTMQRKGK